MAKILLIETSTTQCSVALAEGGTPVAWKEERAAQGYVHAERLMPFVDAVLAAADFVAFCAVLRRAAAKRK